MRQRHWIYIGAGLLLAAVLVWFFLNKGLNTKDVRNFIQEQLPENIELNYDKLSTNFFVGSFKLKNAEVFIKDRGMRINVDELKIADLDYNNLLNTDTIDIGVTDIKNAFVSIDKSKIDSSHVSEKPNRRNIIIKLDELDIDFKGLEMRDHLGNIQTRMNGTQMGLNDLMVQTKPRVAKNQLHYALVKIKSDSIVLPLSNTQQIVVGELELDSTQFRLRDTRLTLQDKGIDINFDLLDLKSEDFNHILQKDTIVFSECLLSKGNIKINNAKKQTQATKDSLEAADKVILIHEFRVKDTNFEFIDRQGKPQLKFANTDAYFTDLKVLTAPSPTENAITYTFINLNAKNLNYPMNHLHSMTVQDIKVDQNTATLNQLRIKPSFSRAAFQDQIKQEQDMITLTVPSVAVSGYDFSFDEVNNFFSASDIVLNGADLNVYRDKTKPDQTPRKPLYSEMLRKLKFRLAVDRIKLNNAKIVYEEKVSPSEQPGKIYFSNFNGTVSNFHNKSPGNDLVKIAVDAKFMGHAPTHVDWNFNIHNPADHFTISGSVNSLDANSLDSFLIPNMRAELDGNVKKTSFSFTGNDKGAGGSMDMLYEDLKIDVLNHRNEKKGVVSTVANFLVKSKKDKDDKVNNLVSVDRDQKKSFFNLFWLALKEGLKQNMMKFQSRKDKVKKD